jgi:hypothetical protein
VKKRKRKAPAQAETAEVDPWLEELIEEVRNICGLTNSKGRLIIGAKGFTILYPDGTRTTRGDLNFGFLDY